MFSAESDDKLWKAMPKHSPLALKAGPALLDDVLIAMLAMLAMVSLNGIILTRLSSLFLSSCCLSCHPGG